MAEYTASAERRVGLFTGRPGKQLLSVFLTVSLTVFVSMAAGCAADSGSGSVPDVTLATIEGGQIDFGALEGQDALIWFWAPW